jgi:hypothetical protein
MIDFSHIASTPGYDVQYFVGGVNTTLVQWQTWRKPRGAKMIYMLGVGGGASGGAGFTGTTAAGGGSGGGSGGQSTVIIPAAFVPDTLYIQCGAGGIGPATSAALSVVGLPTYVAIEPDTTLTAIMTVLFANPGANGTAGASATAGGTATTAATAATIAQMPLAGRGFYTLLAGQIGTAGGAGTGTTAGIIQTLPTTGLMVSGGTGGGASGTTGNFGGTFANVGLGQDIFPTIFGGNSAVTSTPATGGANYIARNFLMNYGGTGGGGATTTTGGIAGPGSDGAPGCGGGGGAGATTQNATLSKAGNGGPGFVYIITW